MLALARLAGWMQLTSPVQNVHDLFYASRDHRRGIFARLARRDAVRLGPRGWP
jgi:hypothetical protein